MHAMRLQFGGAPPPPAAPPREEYGIDAETAPRPSGPSRTGFAAPAPGGPPLGPPSGEPYGLNSDIAAAGAAGMLPLPPQGGQGINPAPLMRAGLHGEVAVPPPQGQYNPALGPPPPGGPQQQQPYGLNADIAAAGLQRPPGPFPPGMGMPPQVRCCCFLGARDVWLKGSAQLAATGIPCAFDDVQSHAPSSACFIVHRCRGWAWAPTRISTRCHLLSSHWTSCPLTRGLCT